LTGHWQPAAHSTSFVLKYIIIIIIIIVVVVVEMWTSLAGDINSHTYTPF